MNGIVADHRQESDTAWLLSAALICRLAPMCMNTETGTLLTHARFL